MISLNILCIWIYHIITIHNSPFLSINLPGITLSFFHINNLYFSFTKFNVVFVSCMVTSNITNIQSINLTHAFPPCLCYTLTPQHASSICRMNHIYYWPTILTLLGILLWLNWSTFISNKLINLSMMTSLYEKFVSFWAQFKGPIIRKWLNRNICSYTILIGYYIL